MESLNDVKFCQNFIKPALPKEEYVVKGNILCTNNYLKLDDVFPGSEAKVLINELSSDEKHDFKTRTFDFYICTVEKMLKRLPIKEDLFTELQFILPSVTFNRNRSTLLSNLHFLSNHYKNLFNCDIGLPIEEWRNLPFHFHDEEISEFTNVPISKMWRKTM